MASIVSTPCLLPGACHFARFPHVSSPSVLRFSGNDQFLRRSRGLTVVTRAGPSATTYMFAFAIPFSLLAITIAASIKIADKIDKDFLEEVAINQAIREAEEEDDVEIPLEEIVKEPVVQRNRNRPKREM